LIESASLGKKGMIGPGSGSIFGESASTGSSSKIHATTLLDLPKH